MRIVCDHHTREKLTKISQTSEYGDTVEAGTCHCGRFFNHVTGYHSLDPKNRVTNKNCTFCPEHQQALALVRQEDDCLSYHCFKDNCTCELPTPSAVSSLLDT